jgi:Cu/Zn superoxide dismutase
MIQERKVVTEALDAQGVLQPGQEGFWQHWGASARDIHPGDLILVKWVNDDGTTKEITEHEVVTAEDKTGVVAVTDTEGNSFWVGWLQRITLLRQGTHNTLSDYCR